MFGAKQPPVAANPKIVSLIDRNTRIEGDLMFSGGLQVDGEIHGKVLATDENSALTVSEHGKIHGAVVVPALILNGNIRGPVKAAHLILGAKAHISGDVCYARIQIELGAIIEGRMLLASETTGVAPASLPDKALASEKPRPVKPAES